jgi:vacuolar-type H+-ATPase subunit H
MAEKEVEVIGHLLDVERQASGVLLDARAEADKRILQARSKADALFNARYEVLVKDYEKDFAQKKSEITARYEQDRAAIIERGKSAGQDLPAFNALVEKLLFA